MGFERVETFNWCQHRHRVLTFSPHMTGIVGANGKGKSNILTALLYLLTGDYSRNPGDKKGNIYWFAGDRPKAYVSGSYVHNGVRYNIQRFLAGGTSQMSITSLTGERITEDVTTDTKITASLMKALDTTPELVAAYGIVGQNELFRTFDRTVRPAERMALLQKLFQIDRAEALWEAIGKELSRFSAVALEPIDPLLAEEKEKVAAVAKLEGDYSPLMAWGTWEEHLDPVSQVVSRYNAAATARPMLAGVCETRAGTVRYLLRLLNEEHTQRQLHSQYVYGLQAGQAQAAQCAATLQQRDREAAVQSTLQSLAARQQQAATRRQTLGARPSGPNVGEGSADYSQQLSDYRAQKRVHEQTISRLTSLGAAAVCPTCGQPVPEDTSVQRDAARVHIESLDASIKLADELRKRAEQIEQTCADYDRQLREIDNEFVTIEQLRAQVVSGGPTAAAAAVVQAQQFLDDMRLLEDGKKDCESRLSVLSQQIEEAYKPLAGQRQQVRHVRAALRNVPTEAAYAQATQHLTSARQWRSQAQLLAGQLASARSELSSLQQRIATHRAMMASHERGEAIRRRLTGSREVLHREALPREIIKRRLAELVAPVTQQLQFFENPFAIDLAAEDATYDARFPNGGRCELGRLSGGQKTQFGLSFCMARHLRFARGLGLLGLDEPTTGLDKDNIKRVDPMLQSIRAQAVARGLQVIVVTHEEMAAFDHVERID